MPKRQNKEDRFQNEICKKPKITEEGPKFKVSSQEELDINLLRFQNRKLNERLETRIKTESDLRNRIEQLEKKQTSTETIVFLINRYWNQFNEDLRISLQRFDSETSDEQENCNENEATTSFISQLTNWDKEELEENLKQRIEGSTRAVGKILQAFDRIIQRNQKITSSLSCIGTDSNLNESVKQANIELQTENKNLNILVTSLHEKNRNLNLKYNEIKDKVESLENLNDDLKVRIDDLEFDLNRTRSKEIRLQEHLQEAREKLRNIDTNSINSESNGQYRKDNLLSQAKIEEYQREIEEIRELANNRLIELETLNNQYKETLKTAKKLEMDLKCLPENVIFETVEYKCLQSHFSVLYNESMQLRTQLEETRNMIASSKTVHLRQIEHMESEELSMQKRLRTEVIQLEDQLAQVRKEYEMLRLEFEQNLAANEQTGPINREIKSLTASLQNHNSQLKGENLRFKRRLKEANNEISKLKQDLETAQLENSNNSNNNINVKCENIKQELNTSIESTNNQEQQKLRIESEFNSKEKNDGNIFVKETSSENIVNGVNFLPFVKKEPDFSLSSNEYSNQYSTPINHFKKSPLDSVVKLENHEALNIKYDKLFKKKLEQDNLIRDLKNQIKKISDQYKELKLLLDMHKTAPKDLREKVQLMANEKKYKIECEELRKQLIKIQEESKKDRKKFYDEDALKEIIKLKEDNEQLQKKITLQKQEDEALLNEMEVTGSAFEDMQEQNIRLTQQLKEKDDANFKLMSERIKSQQIQKLLKEEKECLTEQIISLQSQVEAQNQVVRKLEEKERLLQNNLSTIEKELSVRQQAMELHKRKAIESAQSSADLKLHLDKYLAQLKEAQSSLAEKSSTHQQESFKTKRLHEELTSWKRKYERAKKFELASTADEVLLEEIREYKEQLTCPSCKVNRKDAVLTKCFHVFCYDCLKTRYDSRQRKCPKCNAAIGAHDFHRLYLA